MKTLLYILHSGQRYGTERMALATLAQLSPYAETVLFAPTGPVQQLAAEQQTTCLSFNNKRQLASQLWRYLGRNELSICTTGVSQALIVSLLSLLRGKWPAQIHVVHGGTDETLSYGRKHWLQCLGIELVAVSAFVKSRLLAHGCKPRHITTIENFLISHQDQRAAFTHSGIGRICMMTRIDPIKQVGVAITAWEMHSALPELLICGTGWQSEELQAKSAHLPQIKWLGFVEYPSQILLGCDLYIHTCDNEPFGLAILEAMDAGVPVLVPDQGGAAALVQNGVTGFHYRAGDSADLAWQITRIAQLPASKLNQIVAAAHDQLKQRFSASARIADYAQLCGINGGGL
ncbi:glycosyltransferase family 4 protein [Chitinibacter bivalviorum]|uniref:Glycosyltransferase family 4 protein n=1 Tax=Chitinibacter bivalviorum TaxID=2739434 RepID=A0A7H9BGD3_9NEIS|nr:glycosyltransferase family 4 protein [Chitinibacter bivalviorum]QLG87783.1 glycosyltransferase family 4 protein [Chitinibacter bivalviorum]